MSRYQQSCDNRKVMMQNKEKKVSPVDSLTFLTGFNQTREVRHFAFQDNNNMGNPEIPSSTAEFIRRPKE